MKIESTDEHVLRCVCGLDGCKMLLAVETFPGQDRVMITIPQGDDQDDYADFPFSLSELRAALAEDQ